MHIKRIIIQGFKTFRDRTVIDIESPNFNVVVGRNGSGKSNFFSAIRFVLSDAYTHMSRDERQGLIHEGSGTVISAYVEIIFDNSDRRFPISKDDVSIRRTIGLKKDDYSLDGKSATRSDIMSLLESSAFSRSNPYYIVPQGRITSLTNSKDSERLNLLKDVSGAKVFETKLKESLREMENSNLKRVRIDEALHSISERLEDLQIESNDLVEFQHLDKTRRILEFNLFDRELNDSNTEAEQIEQKYQDHLSSTTQELKVLESAEVEIKQLTDEINDLNTNFKIMNLEKDQNQVYYKQVLTEISQKEVRLDELDSEMDSIRLNQESVKSSIKYYQDLIFTTKENIAQLKPTLNQLNSQESTLKTSLIELSTKQRAIYSKQSRFEKFNTKKQRDQWLKQEISNLKKDLSTKNVEYERLTAAIELKESRFQEINESIEDFTKKLENETSLESMNTIQAEINELKEEINNTSDERKALWRSEIKYRSIHDSLTNDLNNATNLVNQTMDRLQSKGLEAVQKITESLNLQQNVLGPLVDLFGVNDKYKTAVEVVAGNSLFHVLVDTDETASTIMEELVRLNAGRVTFIPLNRIQQPQNVTYPQSNNCIPLIKKIKFTDKRITSVIQQVFGKTIVVSDLVKGAEFSREYNLTAITLDGDRIDTKGALTGGYRDYKTLRLDAIKLQSKKRKDLAENDVELSKVQASIETINQDFTDLNNTLNSRLKSLNSRYASVEPLKFELNQLKKESVSLQQEISSLRANMEAVNSIKQNLSTNLEQHNNELASDFTDTLSDEEKQLMADMAEEIIEKENDLNKIVTESAEVETELSKLESDLTINYRPHLEKILDAANNPINTRNHYEIDVLKIDLERLNSQLRSIKERNTSVANQHNELNDEIEAKTLLLKQKNDKQLKLIEKIEKTGKKIEKLSNKKAIITARRDEINKKINEIGVLPEEAFDHEKYEAYASDELLTQLVSTNNELKKYNHINKRAIDQYNTFTTKRDDLLSRRAELDESKTSIETLIETLKLQKENAIRKSFKAVSESFHDIFEKLVPQGVGRLVMQKKANGDEDARIEETEDLDMQRSGIEDYVGVSIKVSFNSKHDEQQRIEQLSGGQKSLCAIALILAIQKCDPAPFYLFDEIDANLDTQYRTAVSTMISNLSSNAQFICTTFRPEMLQVADKFFGATFSNKVTTITEISRDEATFFVEGSTH